MDNGRDGFSDFTGRGGARRARLVSETITAGIVLALAVGLAASSCGTGAGMTAGADGGEIDVRLVVNCVTQPPSDEAVLKTGPHPQGGYILPGARRIRPEGKLLPLYGFPLNLVHLPDERYVVVTGAGFRSHLLWMIDLDTEEITDQVDHEMLFYGLAVNDAATRLYAGGGENGEVYIYDLDLANGLLLPSGIIQTDGWVGAVATSPDQRELYVLDNDGSYLIVVDLASQEQVGKIKVGRRPYDIKIDKVRNKAYTTLWWDNEVVVTDLATLEVEDRIEVQKNPQNMVISGDGERLYVTNTDSDTLAIIDLETRQIITTRKVGPIEGLPRGLSPSHIALSADDQRLLVTVAGMNGVEIYDAVSLERLGAIPAAFYPSAVLAAGDSDAVFILNGKGVGTGPGFSGAVEDYMWGNIQITVMPSDARLAALNRQMVEDYTRPVEVSPKLVCRGEPKVFPVPSEPGGPTPIEHVILIIRENKTYDSELGDLETGQGDPDLVLFGEWYTPNLHALARRFTSLDNFYTNGEISLQGHQWLTAGMSNDFYERTVYDGSGHRSLANFSTADVGFPEGGYLWAHLRAYDVDYVNYGQVVGIVTDGKEGWDLDFPAPAFNMDVKDVKKAQYVIDKIQQGLLPTFTYLLLPNNHTFGSKVDKPTPASMVADNDEATGMIIDALSHSPFWESSVIFIVEDDPQQGGDHVDMHRSICLVVSPWAKRGYTSRVNHDIPSLWRTIALMVGMGPLSIHDLNAAPMLDAFGPIPDLEPYDYIPRNVPEEINLPSAVGAAESEKMNFSVPDQAKGLSRLLWRIMKGTEPPWPEAPHWPDPD